MIPSRALIVPLVTVATALTISACGDSAASVVIPETTAATTSTTVAPTTTTTSTTTSTTTTTTSTTTTTVTLPTPVPPPQDTRSTEPVIELASMSIPAIDLDSMMFEGIRLTTLDLGPGHWPGTAMPGDLGNVVVAGHRTSKHQVFRNLDQLVPGDEIIFEDDNGRHVYLVERTEVVEPTALWIIDQTPESTVTLFACHPPGSTAQRIVVFGTLAG
jgi:sortase A